MHIFSSRKLLPNHNQRLKKENFIPFLNTRVKGFKKKMFDEVNIVGKGESFNLQNLKKFKKPTFLVGFANSLKVKGNKIQYYHEKGDYRYKLVKEKVKRFKKKNLFYIVTNPLLTKYININENIVFYNVKYKKFDTLKKNKKKLQEGFQNLKRFKKIRHASSIQNIYNHKYLNNKFFAPTGSIIPAIYLFFNKAKKINVYGWDFYLNKEASKLNIFEFLCQLYKFKPDVMRSFNHLESALLNVYFAYILSKKKKIRIKSYLKDVSKHKGVISKFEKNLLN